MRIAQKLTIGFDLPDLNSYINTARTNPYASNNIKRDFTEAIALLAKLELRPIEHYPVHFTFEYYVRNRRKDKDNIDFAKKFILDGLVEGGILKNDNWSSIDDSWESKFYLSSSPRVVVTIKECDLTGKKPRNT